MVAQLFPINGEFVDTNEEYIQVLQEQVDVLKSVSGNITGVALLVTYEDGSIVYVDTEDRYHMITALEVEKMKLVHGIIVEDEKEK
jgi:hypothetical protein